MIRYCASWLPVIRDHLVKEGRHAASLGLLEGPMYEDIVRGFYAEMDTLSNAPLYWVSGDMETLVCDTLTNGPLPPARLLPASTGFMCFEKSIIIVDHHDGRTVPVDGVSWEMYLGASGTVDDAELSVRCYSRSSEFLASVSDKSLPLGPVANLTDGLSHDAGAIHGNGPSLPLRSRAWQGRGDGATEQREERHEEDHKEDCGAAQCL